MFARLCCRRWEIFFNVLLDPVQVPEDLGEGHGQGRLAVASRVEGRHPRCVGVISEPAEEHSPGIPLQQENNVQTGCTDLYRAHKNRA
ncbi:hypothetical protein CDAR_537781 [Caerostris darwini]|uniref:Uncharacterized protein n=1 Tax=Caerostris darwini TaxID=1538125 RepID=A0AAV4RVV9_9ARAC|nr:hypothetical protein CDAR_537781 [Caerostris darwini]